MDQSTPMWSDVPIDASYCKRKRQIYLSERVLSKTRSYFEFNAGASMILNTLMAKIERSCRGLTASCHVALEQVEHWAQSDLKEHEKAVAVWQRTETKLKRRHKNDEATLKKLDELRVQHTAEPPERPCPPRLTGAGLRASLHDTAGQELYYAVESLKRDRLSGRIVVGDTFVFAGVRKVSKPDENSADGAMKTVLRRSIVSPDVDRSDRRIPTSVAHALYYVLLRMSGLTADRVRALDDILWIDGTTQREQPATRREAYNDYWKGKNGGKGKGDKNI
eukprot:4796411-Amphidinium_carterae.1